MYEIRKDGLAFHVNEEERAMQYADDGYEVYRIDRMRVNDNGELEVDEPIPQTGTGQSEELPSLESHTIGG